jgi:3-isopropylmalate/(R)-2-methylmalate dehydratase small subunit
MKDFNGEVLFLDRSDINTDEIIPARYLTEITKEALKPHLLEDLELPGFTPERITGKRIIITRENFGCGSSREHAPWALEQNGINMVLAVSFARIFRQNMYNCGMIALELENSTIERLFRDYSSEGLIIQVNLKEEKLILTKSGSNRKTEEISFALPEFDRVLVEAGGWVDFADARYS